RVRADENQPVWEPPSGQQVAPDQDSWKDADSPSNQQAPPDQDSWKNANPPGNERATRDPPSWENPNLAGSEQAEPDDSGLVKWHIGLRVGPYVPDIDKQFGMSP